MADGHLVMVVAASASGNELSHVLQKAEALVSARCQWSLVATLGLHLYDFLRG